MTMTLATLILTHIALVGLLTGAALSVGSLSKC
jgi:hypothetical protein